MYKIISLILILSIYFNLVSAEDIPQYDIEIILFEHKNYTSIDSEVWPLSPEMPATEGAVNLLHPNAVVYSDSLNKVSSSAPINLSLLNSSHYQMSENMQKLMASESYNPLFHVAWRQNVYGDDDAQAIHITTDKRQPVTTANETTEQKSTNATIDGTIVISLKRFLHLKADLAYINLEASNFFSDAEVPVVFRMMESRRMRSKNIHYLDHPKFGMLALITPYEPPPAPAPAPIAEPVTETPASKTP